MGFHYDLCRTWRFLCLNIFFLEPGGFAVSRFTEFDYRSNIELVTQYSM